MTQTTGGLARLWTRRPALRARALVPVAIALVAPLLLAALVLQLWKADFAAPLVYTRDALENLTLVKNTLEQGWPLHNPLLGAPFGQDLADFPVVAGDPLHILIVKFFGLFSSNPATVMNLFFLAQFPIISGAALWAFRRLGVAQWPAIACAVLFALAPYHLYRGELHVFLAGCWGVPLGLYLVLTILLGRPLPGWRVLIPLCLIIGMSEVYYAVMTLLLMALATGISAARPRWRALAVPATLAMVMIAATVAVAHLPTVLYHARHGQNAEIQKSRDPAQSETFGMRITRVLLPADGHRLQPLAKLTAKYERETDSQLDETAPQALGTLGSVGFLVLLAVAIIALLPGRGQRPPPLLAAAALATLAAVLIGTSGGFSGVISHFVSHALRSWNRYSVYLAFLALIPVALGLTAARQALRRRGLGTGAYAVVLGAIVVLGAFDQAGHSAVPRYRTVQTEWRTEAAFVHAVEGRLPVGAAVYEAPYVPFPEWGYDMARGYLHSKRLRWSFGAMEDRPADWAHALLSQPGNVIVPSVAAAGFAALWVDRGLYPDHGAAADKELRAQMGPPMLTSADGRFEVYDLRPYRARMNVTLGSRATARLGLLTLHPPRAVFGPAFGPAEPGGALFAVSNDRWTNAPEASMDIYNPLPYARLARIQVALATDVPAMLALQLPDGAVVRISLGTASTPFDRTMMLRPGHNKISLISDLPRTTSRKDYVDLHDFRLMDARAQALAVRASTGPR